jgi:hypothetical protein
VQAGAELDYEIKNSYSVRVTASDGTFSSYVDVTISVADVVIDYDSDNDGLIEVDSLAQLNAIRWDLDGDGAPDQNSNAASYAAAFPEAPATLGCPRTCQGYERRTWTSTPTPTPRTIPTRIGPPSGTIQIPLSPYLRAAATPYPT